MNHVPYKNINKIVNGVLYLGGQEINSSFEKAYINVRKKEGRLFTDQLVSDLPHLPETHDLYEEWLYRSYTQQRFCKYLSKKKNIGNILDIGCGNGWFTSKLKLSGSGSIICGLDLNTTELDQAARLFVDDHIFFLFGNVFDEVFHPKSFDLIVLNGSVQYFPDCRLLLNRLIELSTSNGEIHILDSPIYKSKKEKEGAKSRSIKYYNKLGYSEMSSYYHHHTYNDFEGYNYKMMFEPKSIKSRLSRFLGKKNSFFPWIRII